MILGLLLGNSSVRFGVFEGPRIVRSESLPARSLPGVAARFGELLRELPLEEVIVGSVRDDLLEELLASAPQELPRVSVARHDFPLPIENRYRRPEEVGTDRLLNGVAAAERADGRGAIVVDFGTAVSLSAVGVDGAFLGGLIAAGPSTIAQGLAKATPRLPPLGKVAAGGFVRRSTREALSSGVYWEIAGGVERMLRGLREELALAAPLVLVTGGAAPLFRGALPAVDAEVPDLTLEGLFLAARARTG